MKVDSAFGIITYSMVITWRNDIVCATGDCSYQKKNDLGTHNYVLGSYFFSSGEQTPVFVQISMFVSCHIYNTLINYHCIYCPAYSNGI